MGHIRHWVGTATSERRGPSRPCLAILAQFSESLLFCTVSTDSGSGPHRMCEHLEHLSQHAPLFVCFFAAWACTQVRHCP